MSLTTCDECESYIDTDDFPEVYRKDGRCLCDACDFGEAFEEQVKELIQLGVSMKEIAKDWQVTHPHESAKLFQYGNDIIYDWAKKARGLDDNN